MKSTIQVFEVFNDERELMALKVVDLSEMRVRDELVKEIYFLKKLKKCPRVIRFRCFLVSFNNISRYFPVFFEKLNLSEFD